MLKRNAKNVKVDECLKAFHQLSSNAEVMENLQKHLYNTSSDFVTWFFNKGIRSELQAKDDKYIIIYCEQS